MPILICERGDAKGATLKLEPGKTYVVGRDPKSDVPVGDILLSRRHFEIAANGTTFFINDLASRNGTLLNDEAVTRQASLAIGDKIQAGECVFSFLSDRKEESAGGLVGKTIGGYHVLERIGRGGMGTVYKANQLSLNRVVALKVLAARLLKDTSFVEKFKGEARAAGALNHPNIVQVFDVGTEGGLHFFSMEFIDGGSLQDAVGKDEAIEWSEALPLMMDAARGLVYAESRDIVHRDIKPDNLMLTADGRVKIGDLGLAIEKSAARDASGNAIFGTPHFISPEQARGREVGHAADLYSLGAAFYRVLGGKTPFQGESVKEIIRQQIQDEPVPLDKLNPAIPDDLCSVVKKLMRKEPSERFASAQELVDELEKIRIRHHLGVKAGSRRALVIALIAVLLVAVAAIAYLGSREPETVRTGETEEQRIARLEREREAAEERDRLAASQRATTAQARLAEIRGEAPNYAGRVDVNNYTGEKWDQAIEKIRKEVLDRYGETEAAAEAKLWIDGVEKERARIRADVLAKRGEEARLRTEAELAVDAAESKIRAQITAGAFGPAMETFKSTDRKPFATHPDLVERYDALAAVLEGEARDHLAAVQAEVAAGAEKTDDLAAMQGALARLRTFIEEWPNLSEPVFSEGRDWASQLRAKVERSIKELGRTKLLAEDRARWVDTLIAHRPVGSASCPVFEYRFEDAAKALEAKRDVFRTSAYRARLEGKIATLRRMERAMRTIVDAINGTGRKVLSRAYLDAAEGEIEHATRTEMSWTGQIGRVSIRKEIRFDSLTPRDFVSKLLRTGPEGPLRFDLNLEDRLDFALLLTEVGRPKEGNAILGSTRDFPEEMQEEFRRISKFVDTEYMAAIEWEAIKAAREASGQDPALLRNVLSRLKMFRSAFEHTEIYLLLGVRPDPKTELLSEAERDAYLESLVTPE